MDPTSEWKRSIDGAIKNKDWDEYDGWITAEVDEYNRRFERSPGYGYLDWRLVKAMLWVESGGPANRAWRTRPMQIGNRGDPGYGVLTKGAEGADVIMSTQLKNDIANGDINDPKLNIRAGIAYLLVRMARTDVKSVVDPGDKPRDYSVATGDSFDRIARREGSTVEVLRQLNPGLGPLIPGQKIKIRKASLRRIITGWRAFDSTTVARRYNVGDAAYAAKLDYVMAAFDRLKR